MVDRPDPFQAPDGGYQLAPLPLVNYRVIFKTGGTPPRSIRATRIAADPDLPLMIAFKDVDDRTVCWVNQSDVLFIDERTMHIADDDAQDRSGVTAQAGMTRVAGAGRPGR